MSLIYISIWGELVRHMGIPLITANPKDKDVKVKQKCALVVNYYIFFAMLSISKLFTSSLLRLRMLDAPQSSGIINLYRSAITNASDNIYCCILNLLANLSNNYVSIC